MIGKGAFGEVSGAFPCILFHHLCCWDPSFPLLDSITKPLHMPDGMRAIMPFPSTLSDTPFVVRFAWCKKLTPDACTR